MLGGEQAVELREFNITSAFLENPTANPDQLVAMYMGDFYVTPNNGERSELMNFMEFEDSYMSTLTEESFPLKIEQTYSLAIESIEDQYGLQILMSLPDMETQFERTLSGTLTYTDASSETGESEYTFDSGTSLMNWLVSVAPDEESQIAMFPMTVDFDPIVKISSGIAIVGDDYAVTDIAESAFAGNTSIESAVLPDSIITIDSYAFADCVNLKSINIPNDVTTLGTFIFDGCTSLETVVYNAINCVNYGFESNSQYNTPFQNVNPNVEIVISSNVKILPDYFLAYRTMSGSNKIEESVQVSKVELEENSQLEYIGAYAFYGSSLLTEIEIPSSVTDIGNLAFSGCSSLTTVTFGENSQLESMGYGTFYGCSSLTTVTFGENSQLTSIGGDAFSGCSNLTSITIPENVTSIGNSAFRDCSSLTDVYCGGDINDWVTISFGDYNANPLNYGADLYLNGDTMTPVSGEINIDRAANIGRYTFSGWDGLTKVTIGDQVTSIGDSAFSGCSNLTIVTFGENSQLISIGSYAFYDCSSLSTVTFGENSQLTSIGNNAFSSCSSLTSITIPSNVTSIGQYAFNNCRVLTTVTFAENSQLESIREYTFNNCSSLTSITIPEGVTSIKSSAFYDCTGLTEINFNATDMSDLSSSNYVFYDAGQDGSGIVVNIGANVTRIPAYIFCPHTSIPGNPPNIISVNFEEGSQCTEIGDYAFRDCISLTNITIPENVISIGNGAFWDCTGLTEINYNAINMSDLSDGNNVFYDAGEDSRGIVVNIGASVIRIPAYLFYPYRGFSNYSLNIISVNFTEDSQCTEIRNYAFQNCSNLTSITIPSSVTSIGSYAFSGCSSLSTVTFGENSQLTSIGNNAFSSCSSLTSITIPENVASIGNYAFSGCSSLQYNINDGGLYLGNTKNLYMLLVDTETTDMTEFTIHSECKIIHSNAFKSCSSLTTITIPSSVTSIGNDAFLYCRSLTSIAIPSSVTSIGTYAFSGCSSLTTVTFENTRGWYRTTSSTATSGTSVTVTNPTQNATYLKSTYRDYYWKRNA